MRRVMCVTNVWNEHDNIPALFETIKAQTVSPVCWVWIDDGSTDGSSDVIKAEAVKSDIPVKCFSLPIKQTGNHDTIGRAYNEVMPQLKQLDYDYMTIVDVETILPPDYFETMCEVMEDNSDVGAVAGKVKDESHRTHMPMGGGKFVRSDIVKHIKRYWDLAPDSFLNIMAVDAGYHLLSLRQVEIIAPPSTIFSSMGKFRYGRRQYYIGRSISGVISLAITLLLKRDHASEFLRGYWSEWQRGVWKCDIPEVRDYYSDRKYLDKFQHDKSQPIIADNLSSREKIFGLIRFGIHLLLLTPVIVRDMIKRIL